MGSIAMTDIRLPPKWIELNIMKRECCTFISSSEDQNICQCGRRKDEHDEFVKRQHHGIWNPADHTRASPTDAYGSVLFEGEQHQNKAHFVRLSHDTNPELVLQLITLVWGVPMPKLLITIQGSTANFVLPERLGKVMQCGLVKAANQCDAWIFTNGLNDGVTKHIGVVLSRERNANFKRGSRIVAVGIPSWGLVDQREELLVKNKDVTYNTIEKLQSKFRALNSKHNNFLLVDNGSVGKVGGETYFRKRLEKCIAHHPIGRSGGCRVPVVCVVIEGGLFTLRTIGDYLNDDPPTPVVLVAGSGRTADLVASLVKRVQQLPSDAKLENLKEEVSATLIKTYGVTQSQCPVLLAELRRIMSKKHLITIYNIYSTIEDFDVVILQSIFRSQHFSPLQQLSLALVWNRVDLAEAEVFVYARELSSDHLEQVMMEALICNRVDFVSLLLEHGVNMNHFLTLWKLESLYNVEGADVLKYVVGDLARIRSRRPSALESQGIHLSLHDVGIAVSYMIGHSYKSNYIHMSSDAIGSLSKYGLGYVDDSSRNAASRKLSFVHPFDDLFLWAVLTKRHELAVLLWRHGHGALVKALIAVKLNKFIAEMLMEKADPNLALDFERCASHWEHTSYELVDSCFKVDQKLSRQLLIMEQPLNWSKMTNLQLAVIANHRLLLGHPCFQILLADLWMGALAIRSHSTIKVLLGILCPFYIFFLDFKSSEELRLLPHQEKLIRNEEDDGYDEDSTNSIQTQDSRTKSTVFGSASKKDRQRQPHKTPNLLTVPASNLLAGENHATGEITIKELPVGSHVAVQADNESSAAALDDFRHIPLESKLFLGRNQRHNRSSFVTTTHSLSAWKKFYEFQRAPVTNFFRHALAYVAFVCLFSYLILVPQDPDNPTRLEIYIVCYLASLGVEVVREFIMIDALNCSQKLAEFKSRVWLIGDLIFVTFFMAGFILRVCDNFEYGMLIYRISSMYWNLRLYKYMSVHRFLGPKIVMMFKMLKHMAYFAMIILVVILTFGMARESIRYPNTYPTWRTIYEALLEPYVMMFGEVDSQEISHQCEDPDKCPVGHWVIPVAWVIYMMVSNILIVNVLIAVFNSIYSKFDEMALEVWLFQRFNFVLEVERKPLVPPPAMILCHIYMVLHWLFKKIKTMLCEQELESKLDEEDGQKIFLGRNDHRLKAYLTPAEASVVLDFEEQSMASLVIRLPGSNEDNVFSFPRYDNSPEVYRDRQLQQLRTSIQEIAAVLESHREKLDKLLNYWEDEVDEIQSSNSRSLVNRAPHSRSGEQ